MIAILLRSAVIGAIFENNWSILARTGGISRLNAVCKNCDVPSDSYARDRLGFCIVPDKYTDFVAKSPKTGLGEFLQCVA
jgi:hypothetical protein